MGSSGFENEQRAWLNSRGSAYRTAMVYAIVGSLFVSIGYWWFTESSEVTSMYFAREPKTPPDVDLWYSNTSKSTSKTSVKQNIVLIRERDPEDNVQVMYWSPQRPDEWGSIEIEFQWAPDFDPGFAIFYPNLHVFGMFDVMADGELAVLSESTQNRWVTLAVARSDQSKFALQYPIDVTRWVKGSHSFRIRYRVKASRLMYHPTPNDPIGLAAAQCLRQQIDKKDPKESDYPAKLRLWRHYPNEDNKGNEDHATRLSENP